MKMAQLNALTLELSISIDLEVNDTNVISLLIFERRRVIQRFAVELSPHNPEPKHTPDSFFYLYHAYRRGATQK